jgi:hypothetical protein
MAITQTQLIMQVLSGTYKSRSMTGMVSEPMQLRYIAKLVINAMRRANQADALADMKGLLKNWRVAVIAGYGDISIQRLDTGFSVNLGSRSKWLVKRGKPTWSPQALADLAKIRLSERARR